MVQNLNYKFRCAFVFRWVWMQRRTSYSLKTAHIWRFTFFLHLFMFIFGSSLIFFSFFSSVWFSKYGHKMTSSHHRLNGIKMMQILSIKYFQQKRKKHFQFQLIVFRCPFFAIRTNGVLCRLNLMPHELWTAYCDRVRYAKLVYQRNQTLLYSSFIVVGVVVIVGILYAFYH